MANGIMRGTGTVDDPYQIEDVFDLCCGYNGNSAYFKMVNDIDFNDHPDYRYGVNTTIFGSIKQYGYHRSLDGNGKKIRNLIIKDATDTFIFNVQNVSNIIFENLIYMNTTGGALFRSCSANPTSSTTCAANNIKIGAYFFDSQSQSLFNAHIQRTDWTDCSFNLMGKTTDGCNLKFGNYTRCHINLDINTTSYDCITATANLNNTYITGKIHQIGSLLANSPLNYILNGGVLTNSYIAVNAMCDTWGFESYGISNISVISTSFIDKDLLPVSESTYSNFYYLTTEQATNPEDLLAINFPVVSTG